MLGLTSLLTALALAGTALSAPAASSSIEVSSSIEITSTIAASSTIPASASIPESASGTSSASSPSASSSDFYPPGPYIDLDPNEPLWDSNSPSESAVPIRGDLGASVLGPNNPEINLQNPDLLAGPSTDHGSVANAKWPFALSHNRLEDGGWARQQNQNAMPIASEMAAVNMRLEKYGIRELHWHKTAEWAYVLKGKTQVTAVNADGQNYVATVGPGDLWYFPAGIPHSLQATADDEEGSEFLLVFDDGAFSEDSTFLLSDWMSHIPAGVIEKNFYHEDNSETFAHIPAEELFIFVGLPTEDDSAAPVSPQGTVPEPFTYALSADSATQLDGGSVRMADTRNFKASKTIAMAEVTVEPGHIRELHWHPTQDEWSFFLEGEGRVTIFAAQGNSRTFSYQAGDIGYVPTAMGHYVENIGTTTLKFLEIFKAPLVEDISLNQWLALTPPALVKAHLGFDDDTIAKLSKTKPTVLGAKIDAA